MKYSLFALAALGLAACGSSGNSSTAPTTTTTEAPVIADPVVEDCPETGTNHTGEVIITQCQ